MKKDITNKQFNKGDYKVDYLKMSKLVNSEEFRKAEPEDIVAGNDSKGLTKNQIMMIIGNRLEYLTRERDKNTVDPTNPPVTKELRICTHLYMAACIGAKGPVLNRRV